MLILKASNNPESADLRYRQARWMCLIWLAFMTTIVDVASQQPQTSLASLWQKAEQQSLMTDSARFYLEQVVEKAKQAGKKELEAEGHYLLGKHYFLMMQDEKARIHFAQAFNHFSQLENWEKAGFSNVQLGLSFIQSNQLDSALISFQTAIGIYRTHELLQHLWTPYMGISSVYQKEGKVSAAFQYGLLSTEALAHTSERTGKVIALKHMLNLARENDSLQIYASVSDQLLKLYSPLELDKQVIQHIDHFVDIREPRQRIEAIRAAIEQLEKWPVTLELVSSYYQLGQGYAEMKNIPLAIQAWEKAYALEKDQLQVVHFAPALLRALGDLYENQGQHAKAISYLKEYNTIREVLQEEYAKAKTEELQLQFETTAKDQQIAAQQMTVDRRTFQRNVILGIIGFLLITGGYVFYTQRRHLRDQQTIALQQSTLHQKEIGDLKKQHEVSNLQTLITAQEEERKRIAQDLHDSLGSLLASLKIQTRKLEKTSSGEEVENAWRDYYKLLDTVSSETRRIAHNIMPPALSRMGLSAALEDLANTIHHDNRLEVAFQHIDYDHALEHEKEITLYHIAQELCANVVRHAEADHLLMQLSRHNGTVTLVVEDNGKGMNIDNTKAIGMGMESIRSRVGLLEGEMEIVSAPGQGTSFTIQIPVS